MHPLYKPSVNAGIRTVLKPFAGLIPEPWQFPVTGSIKVKVGEGKTIRLACNPTSYLAKVLFWQGVEGFEYNLVRVFVELIRHARVFLDVGANIGYYSLLAKAFNPEVAVYSFEPLPSAFHYLEKNLRLNGWEDAVPMQVALSDQTGTARFYASRNPKYVDVEHHLTSTGALDRQQAARSAIIESFEVPTETMDYFIAARGLATVDLVKLDTEASEHLVLAGAHQMLSAHRPIFLCEVLPGKIEQELTAIFKTYGYRMFRAEARRLVPVEKLAHQRATTNDHVMVHPDDLPLIEPFQTS